MKNSLKLSIALAAAASAISGTVQAQSSSAAGSGYSMAGPGSTYIGFNYGQSNYHLNNGVGGFASDQTRNSYSIYGGAYFTEYLGVQLGYTDFDRINRAGGTTYANAFSASLVGRLPLAPSFNLLGRLGTSYSRTSVSSNPLSGIAAGDTSSWGASYGVGAEYNFNPSWSGVVQYDEYRMKFAGTGRDRVNATSLGVRYKF